MRHLSALLVLVLAGCSTAPVADLLDYFQPGTLGPQEVMPYGGVSSPVQAGSPGETLVPAVPAPPPPGALIEPVPTVESAAGVSSPSPAPVPVPDPPPGDIASEAAHLSSVPPSTAPGRTLTPAGR